MMQHSLTKIGGKDFSFYRFVDHKSDRFSRLIMAIIDVGTQIESIDCVIDIKGEGITGIAFVTAAGLIRLKQFCIFQCGF